MARNPNQEEHDELHPKPIEAALNDYYLELPSWIVDKGVKCLSSELPEDVKIQIRDAHSADSKTWWAGYHHGWGTAIRNRLRDSVAKDKELPSGNWDDYYNQLVEVACGLRKMKND